MIIISKFFSKKINITKNNNEILIEIKKNCTPEELTKLLNKTKYKIILTKINLTSIIKSNIINPTKILIIQNNQYIYNIIIQGTKIHISKQNTDIKQSIIINNNVISNVTSTNHNENTILNKKNTLLIASTILEELSEIENISKYINIKDILKNSNIILNKDYYKIIENETITLSWPNRYGSTNILNKTRAQLDIILTETREKIGEITFNYLYNPNTSYRGNISYYIKEEFQNKHYATIALSLLKELLKSHKNKKDIYISTNISNTRSQKVAINNDGELYYEGSIPRTDPLSKHSGITEVKIYKIKI
jgi:predicted acetyltransferase